jgi:hypothetical protein
MTAATTDKLIAELRDRAAALGFALTSRCRYCGRPIWSRRSLRDHAGSRCRAKRKTKP